MTTKSVVKVDREKTRVACTFSPTKRMKKAGFVAYHTRSGKPIPARKLNALYKYVLAPAAKAVMERYDEAGI